MQVSRHEEHFDKSRPPDEDHALDEMVIAEDSPLFHKADEILEHAIAMDKYWTENTQNGN